MAEVVSNDRMFRNLFIKLEIANVATTTDSCRLTGC